MQRLTVKDTNYQTRPNWGETAVSIRQATQADAPSIAKMGYQLVAAAHKGALPAADLNLYLHQAFNLAQVNQELAQLDGRFYLAEVAQAVVGMVKLSPGSPAEAQFGENPIELSRLYLKQVWIGRGVGQALMQHALLEAAKNQHDFCWLMVWAGNRRAIDFYRRWQFTIADRIHYPIGRTSLPAYLMIRSVEA
ncbi:MAG: GNAT family N-acetyltransferase [Ardenticatenaceae bacterium]|nr:GNAT family N-acetyltransferase [Anaerolineales bacterium]MCB8979837.1 GNAT family N-acetyltransferase [Ardenticatenaceae bacterium]